MRRRRFEMLVQRALATIPARFRDELHNLAIIVEDEPDDSLLDDMEVPEGETLFGLYHGLPLTERRWDDGNRLPDQITIFQGPHEREYDDDEIVTAIGETLIHEIGHYFGMSEEAIEEIEEKYWRSRGYEQADSADHDTGENEVDEGDEEDRGEDGDPEDGGTAR